MTVHVPTAVSDIMDSLERAGFQAYLVGGAVRNILLNRTPKDYDIATDALPAEVRALFDRAIPTGEKYGTVTVRSDIDVEVTTFRRDGRYLDGRRPETVEFSRSLKDDVVRRDFTINALAMAKTGEVIDHVGGQDDLRGRVIRCVGDPDTRFKEDALRMMRAHRLAAELGSGFTIDPETLAAIARNAHLITNVSWERIRDELVRLLMSDNPGAVRDLYHSGILKHILPELADCYGFDQSSRHHDKDVFEHIVVALENTPKKLNVRLAALLHDIAKPKTFFVDKEGEGHFYGHDVKSEQMAREVLQRLRFDSHTTDSVCTLVREHMSRYNRLRPRSVKKFISRVGIGNLDDLFDLQKADVKASGHPHDLSKVLALQEDVRRVLDSGEPLELKDLAVDGRDLIAWGMKQGRDVGRVLRHMLEAVWDRPELNTREGLRAVFDELRRRDRRSRNR